LIAVVALAGCSQGSGSSGSSSSDRVAKLHDAAECLRQHGIANFADPVLGANGQVFTDIRGWRARTSPRARWTPR
jgi:hypothetical protein